MKKPNISIEELRELFEYNPETGVLFRRGSHAPAGSKARGYVRVWVKGSRFYAHRLTWMIFNGAEPLGEIDHINGDRADNRISNLRDVTASLNRSNLQKATSRNAIGVLGVRYIERIGKYEARIRKSGKQRVIGYFSDVDDARRAVEAERLKLFSEGLGKQVAHGETSRL